MKLILICLASYCMSSQALEVSPQLIDHANAVIAKFVSQAFLERLEDRVIRGFLEPDHESRISMTVIGPGTDPTILPDLNLPLTYDVTMGEEPAEGELQLRVNSTGSLLYKTPTVSGLSKVTDMLKILGGIGTPLSVTWDYDLPTVSIVGDYVLDQQVEADFLFQVGNEGFHAIAGTGKLDAGVDDVFVRLATKINTASFLEMTELSLDLGLKNVTALSDGTNVDGVEVDIAGALVKYVEPIFNLIWTEENKVKIADAVKVIVNDVIGTCRIGDFIGGNFDCLILPGHSPVTRGTTPGSVSSSPYPTPSSGTTLKPSPSPIHVDIDVDVDVDVEVHIHFD